MSKHKLKGVKLLTDETADRRYVRIDIATPVKEPEAVEDYLDGLIAESRRSEPAISHAALVRSLKKRSARK